MIEQVSLDHGWYYFYRVHTERLGYLPEQFSNLRKYLTSMLTKCPQEHFLKGPRSSKLRLDLGIEPMEVGNHSVSLLAKEALDWGKYNSNHSKVEVFMLNNDPHTLAVETPIWLENTEMTGFEDLFQENKPLSGHIDLLRMEDNKLWVWDFKPNAAKEKYATTQTFFYAMMLSQRTKIPLKNFMCGYFDDETSFVFKPEIKLLNAVKQ